VAYAVWGIKIKKTRQVLIILGVSAVIVAIIISVEHNANKHIHIPEYVLMTWILFEAISIDYRGRGIGILILICASMLGIVDEILQGIHPQRSYGWIDMLINTASSIIGVLTLISICKMPEGDWSWLDNLRKYYKSLIVIFCGAAAAAWMCLMLFEIAAAGTQRKQFPGWLIIWGLIFVLLAGTTISYHFCGLYRLDRVNQMGFSGTISGQRTAHLWIVYPVSILAAINALCIWIGTANTAFR
jgi:hypothetical protein